MLTAHVTLRMFRSQILLIMKCVVLVCILSHVSTHVRRSGYQVQLLLETKPVRMEVPVDTGSAVSIYFYS